MQEDKPIRDKHDKQVEKGLKQYSRITGPKSKRRRKMNHKQTLATLAVLVIVLLSCLILYEIYIGKTATWDDVFQHAGLETLVTTASQPETGQPQGIADPLAPNEARVTFLYAGQADCAVIQAGGTTVLIDAGDYMTEPDIFEFLDANGITRLDYVFATHPHADHIGGMAAVVERYDIGQVFFTNYPAELTPTNYTYTNLLDTLIRTNTPTRTVAVGEVLKLDLGQITVVYNGMFGDLNNCSTILLYEYGECSFLFMGDAEFTAENQMLYNDMVPQADVLKAGHHGTKKATGDQFLSAVKPEYVVVSCGINNSYGYPKEAFINRVANARAVLLRTDLLGNIVFSCDGTNLVLRNDLTSYDASVPGGTDTDLDEAG